MGELASTLSAEEQNRLLSTEQKKTLKIFLFSGGNSGLGPIQSRGNQQFLGVLKKSRPARRDLHLIGRISTGSEDMSVFTLASSASELLTSV